jgi:regulator of sigma E protease
MITVLLVIAILVILIVAHELGHFVAAKVLRVKVEEFGVGYPPRAFTLGKIGDTEYTLNWLPFGGFVRLFGDEGKAEHGTGSLMDSPRWKQAIILVAGVLMNAVAAWALFAIALHLGVPEPVNAVPPGQKAELIVADVVPGSPAYAAGMIPGDQIIGVVDPKGGEAVTGINPDSVVAFIRDHPGRPVEITYKEGGTQKKATMIPAQGVLSKQAGQPALGIALVLVANQSESWRLAAKDALKETYRAFGVVFGDLGSLFSGFARGAPNLSGVVGPVGIVGYVGEAAQNGMGAVLMLAALISVNLAIINLIPVPALDGGRLLILILEAALRRNAPRLAVQILNALGVALIILLMVTVTYHDIGRLLG